ncbi:uncharacterized protein [Hoplias malabaricus]|uniref:uncharacterized protein n=1 Tax=Hoplias malabaricus TaxID=27720 RepID=UPI0034633B0B
MKLMQMVFGCLQLSRPVKSRKTLLRELQREREARARLEAEWKKEKGGWENQIKDLQEARQKERVMLELDLETERQKRAEVEREKSVLEKFWVKHRESLAQMLKTAKSLNEAMRVEREKMERKVHQMEEELQDARKVVEGQRKEVEELRNELRKEKQKKGVALSFCRHLKRLRDEA